jgi:hypothetical protein
MNETNESQNTRFSWWSNRPGWLRGGAILILGLIIGVSIAQPEPAKEKQANAITAKQKSIYAAAYAKREDAQLEYDKLAQQSEDLQTKISDQQAESRADQRAAKKKLTKLRHKITGARTEVAKSTFPGEGTFRVGAEVEPGTYKAAAQSGCYWARLASGDTSDIIDNNNADGPVLLTIEPGDFAIEVAGCSTFHKQ